MVISSIEEENCLLLTGFATDIPLFPIPLISCLCCSTQSSAFIYTTGYQPALRIPPDQRRVTTPTNRQFKRAIPVPVFSSFFLIHDVRPRQELAPYLLTTRALRVPRGGRGVATTADKRPI